MTAEQTKAQKELEAAAKVRKLEWDTLLQDLRNHADDPVTKGELVKVIDFIADDIQGIGEMANIAVHNVNVLHHNFQQLVTVLQGGQTPTMNKTQSGIILP
jgi:hypothetical protein